MRTVHTKYIAPLNSFNAELWFIASAKPGPVIWEKLLGNAMNLSLSLSPHLRAPRSQSHKLMLIPSSQKAN